MYQPSFDSGKSPQARGNIWEKNVANGLSEYLRGKPGSVIHLQKQIIHGRISLPQKIDILVDNAGGHYWGIECKSTGNTSMTLAAWFGSQFERETTFLNDSGRLGIVALLIRSAGGSLTGYLIPWNVVTMIRTRKLTSERLNRFAGQNLIYRLPTMDGTFLIPFEFQLFQKLVRMENRAAKLMDEDIRDIFHSQKKKSPSKSPTTCSLAGCAGNPIS